MKTKNFQKGETSCEKEFFSFFTLGVNHLGNVLQVVTDRKLAQDNGEFDIETYTYTSATPDGIIDFFTSDVVSQSDYYPFGMMLPGRNSSEDEYRYGFNGMEMDDEVSGEGNSYDFGARFYNPRVGRFLKIDNYPKPYHSPYIFAANTPIIGIDINGDSLYILAYPIYGDEMFEAAALTRKHDIERTAGFDPSRDKVILLEVGDISKLKDQVDQTVVDYSGTYGETVEFGIYSHAGLDGPSGGRPTSEGAIDEYQMDLNQWGKIDFNWSESGSRCLFYGCNTSGTYFTDGFAEEISTLPNFEDVLVSGQPSAAYPSVINDGILHKNDNGSKTHKDDFLNEDEKGNVTSFQRTYFVSALSSDGFSLRMEKWKNGSFVERHYPKGKPKTGTAKDSIPSSPAKAPAIIN